MLSNLRSPGSLVVRTSCVNREEAVHTPKQRKPLTKAVRVEQQQRRTKK